MLIILARKINRFLTENLGKATKTNLDKAFEKFEINNKRKI